MRAGPLRYRLEIQAEVEKANATGGFKLEWKTLRTVWGSVEPINSREFKDSAQQKTDATHEVTIRYFKDLRSTHRFKFGDRIFNVSAPPKTDAKTMRELMKVEVKEVESKLE